MFNKHLFTRVFLNKTIFASDRFYRLFTEKDSQKYVSMLRHYEHMAWYLTNLSMVFRWLSPKDLNQLEKNHHKRICSQMNRRYRESFRATLIAYKSKARISETL